MKIRVTTDRYEYQGLYKDSVHTVHNLVERLDGWRYFFQNNGKEWVLKASECVVFVNTEECRSSYCECEEGKCSGGKVDMRADEAEKKKAKWASEKAPIKSDGGSSTYYDIEIEDWLLNLLNERQKEGKCYIKTEELIECGFSSDFDAGNIFKSLVRAFGALNGGGKAGNDVDYECNKIVYSANKLKQRSQRKGE